jgi:hypothetical protein
VLGDQVFDQADALEARASTQGSATSSGLHTRHFGNGGIGLRGIVDLELDQDAAQVALVAGQRSVEQQCALGLVELQQAGQRIDVLSRPGCFGA